MAVARVPPTLGLVLAGGQARRMGGGDKALLRVGGATILHRVLERLRPQCGAIILNANGDPARFAATGLPVVADDVPGFAGPLAGILAGLDWAAAHVPEVAFVGSVPGDCPFLPRDLIGRLHAARAKADTPLACAKSGNWRHPVVGLWPVALRQDLRHALVGRICIKSRYGPAVMGWPWRNGLTNRSTLSSTSTPLRMPRGQKKLLQSTQTPDRDFVIT